MSEVNWQRRTAEIMRFTIARTAPDLPAFAFMVICVRESNRYYEKNCLGVVLQFIYIETLKKPA